MIQRFSIVKNGKLPAPLGQRYSEGDRIFSLCAVLPSITVVEQIPITQVEVLADLIRERNDLKSLLAIPDSILSDLAKFLKL